MSTAVTSAPALSDNPTRQQLEELDALLNSMLKLPVRKECTDAEPLSSEVEAAAQQRAVEAGSVQSDSNESPITEQAVEKVNTGTLPSYVTDETRPIERVEKQAPAVPVSRAPNPDDWVKLAATWQPSSQTWGPLAENWKQSSRSGGNDRRMSEEPGAEPTMALELPSSSPAHDPPTLPASRFATSGVEVAAENIPDVERQGANAARSKASEGISWYLCPLIGFNTAFDTFLFLFGPLGEWLKGRTGRKVLGVVGICSLVIGAGWLVMDSDGILRDLEMWLRDWFGWTG